MDLFSQFETTKLICQSVNPGMIQDNLQKNLEGCVTDASYAYAP